MKGVQERGQNECMEGGGEEEGLSILLNEIVNPDSYCLFAEMQSKGTVTMTN